MHWIQRCWVCLAAVLSAGSESAGLSGTESSVPNVPRGLQIFDPFVTSTFPVGTGISVQLPGGKTTSGSDSGQLDLLVGEVLFGISLTLPQGYFFNVDQARVRMVFGYLSQSEARSGECAPDRLGPVSNQVVQSPLSARFGAAADQALGTTTLNVNLAGGVTFIQAGDYRLCFTDDGSFASGHADLLNVLIRVNAFVTTRLPAGSGLTFLFSDGGEQSANDGENITLSAGQPIARISLRIPLLSVFDASNVRLKAINASVTRTEVLAGACAPGSPLELNTEVLDSPLSDSLGVETLHSRGTFVANTSIWTTNPIRFNSAGRARLCYSDDGSFSTGHVDLISVVITAEGIYSWCQDAGCLAARTFRCHALLGLPSEAGSCELPIPGVLGSFGFISWSARIDGIYSGNGEPLPFQVPLCSSSTADPNAFCVTDCAGGNRSFALTSGASVVMPPSAPLSLAREARTSAVCYCTGLEGCDLEQGQMNFFQPLGLVQLFTASVMPIGEFACTTSSSGILASIPFGACVFCPAGGCPFEKSSRILFARQPAPWLSQTYPAWHPEHRCRHAVHETFLLPEASIAAQVDGGPRSDLKRFRPTEGYTLPNWPTFVPRGNWLDICFNPDISSNDWFKVGQVAVLDAALGSSSTVPSSAGSTPPNQVGQVGQIAMSRSLLPYRNPENVVGLTTGGGIRLAAFIITEDSSTREACQKNRPLDVTGLTRANASEYSGTVRGDSVVFDGGVLGKSISFPSVVTAVVCYCPNLGTLQTDVSQPEFGQQTCLGSPYWVPVGAIVIAGPVPNQYWLLPTLKVFRFEYLGLNLEDGDMLRLILPSQSCGAFTSPERLCLRTNEDPINGHPLCESTFLTANSGLMRTSTLADSRVRCDELNENCASVPLRAVETTSTGLKLTFAGSTSSGGGLGELGLRGGDTIVLGAGVQCGANCSQPMLDMAKGFLGFQGLESYLPLDTDPTTGATADVVGSRSGIYTGSVQSIAGRWGSASRFNAGASLSLPDGAPMEVSQAWTLVLWLRTEKAGWYTICGVADGDGVLEDGEVEIGLAASPWLAGAPFLHQQGGPGAEDQVMAGGVVTAGEWTHVAVVYGGSMSGTLRFYVDGLLSYERLNVALNLSSLPLQCAGRVSNSFSGGAAASDGYLDLDELRWYNVPLTSEDVAALFNATDGAVSDAQQRPGAPIGIAVQATSDPAVFTVAQGSFATAPVPPQFQVDAAGGQWRRSNRGVIRGELMSSYERTLKVCWERGGRAAEAGLVEFVAQSTLTELGIWPTQREWSKSSPFVLTFKTGNADSQGLRYTKAEGHMSLTITYLNQAAIRHMGSSAQGPFVSSFNLDSDERSEASQSVCGIVFRELWSSDQARGFPLPYGCFYRSLTTDMREITVIFEKRNGLSPDTSYQIVMNAAATNEMVAGQELFFISSNDDHEGYRYAALEVGHVFSAADTLYQLGAGNNDPQFAPDVGLEIVGGDDSRNLVTLQDGSTRLQLQMMGGQYSTAKISRGNLLNIWVEPLTAWQLPSTCGDQSDLSVAAGSLRIHCFVIFGTFRRCGEVVKCAGKPVVPFAEQIPQIEIEMPPNMNDLFGPLVYEMDIYSFRLPAQGALPHRLMVQIMKDDATKPHFRVATGRFYTAPTREFATIGRVLTSPQNGLEPFEGVQSHVLYVMLQLAVPLRGFDRSRPPPDVRPDSYFVVQAPPGFRMLEAVPVVHEGAGLGKVTLSADGDAASRLNDTMQPAPTGFGTPDLAGWSFIGGAATYKLLDRSYIPAMTSLVMGLRVYPGNTSLPITNTLNLWSVQVFSPGDHNQTLVNFTAAFYRTGLGGVPVLGRLENALIQPVDPMVSRNVATVQPLSVFFRAVEDVPAGGSIDVEASRVFDFSEHCGAVDLDDGYYVTGPVPSVQRLPRIVSCMSHRDSGQTSGPYNIARIFVEGPLKGLNIYGFSLPVRNPTLAEVSQILSMDDLWSDVDWNLTTRGPEGSPVCATYGGAPGAPDGTGSWRLVNKSIPPKATVSEALATNGPAVAVSLSSWLPFAVTSVASHATMVFVVDVDFGGFLEISAPVGFEWLSALVALQPGAPYNETYSFENLPQVSPSSQGAMLAFLEGQYRSGLRYGFEAPLYVPDFGPVTSLNAFYISLLVANPQGPALPEGISSVVFAEPVRAIVDAMARSSNKLPGSTAELMLKLRIATAVPSPSFLQITMPPGYGPVAGGACGKRPWPGQLDFSGMESLNVATCGFERSVGAINYLGLQYDVFHIMIRPSSTMALMPGLLQFRMDIVNPPAELSAFYTENEAAPGARVCGPACWSFSTLMSDGSIIDKPQTVPSEPPPSEMALGEIMPIWPPGRNDRPSKSSKLIFRFSVGTAGPFKTGDPMPAAQMELVGPPGTAIPSRCYHLVETRVVNLFGSVFNATQVGVDVWDPNSPVTNCEGNGETAVISFSPGLIASNTYAFRIDIVNPPSQTGSNFWTMTLLDHFAKPIPSFSLWAFPEISVSTYARNSQPSCYLGDCVGAGQGIAIPIQLTLRTQNTVNTGGELRILAPLEFGFDPDEAAPLIQGDKQTRCLIHEYENFNLSAVPYTWRMAERYCLIADRGNPLDGSGTGDTRTVRVITRYQQNPFDLRPPKTFHPNATFVLYFWLHPPNTFRPSEAWHLESFTPSGDELDIGSTMGWEVIRVMNLFEHSNTGGINPYTQTISPAVTQGLVVIPNFVIDFVLPANAWLADKLVLTAPKNFQMQLSFMDANAPGSCVDRTLLLPLGVASLEPEATRSAICMAEVMTLPAINFGRALQSGDLCRLLIQLRNPESPPPQEYNYWKLEHVAGSGSRELQSSAIAESWVVIPLIFNISSGITGVLRGAGSRTTIYFNFTVVQSASELQIDALEPMGFEFQDSYASANISERRSVPQILVATWDAFRLVILADPFDNIHLTITDVKISEIPGVSRWRLSTWELPEDDKEGTPYIRDEAYVQGFLVPGKLEVFNAFGQTGRENAAILGRESDLSFDMTSSAPIPPGSDLLVEARGAGHAGFKMFSETAELWTLHPVTGEPDRKLGEWYCSGMSNLFDPENETAQNLTRDMFLPHPSACEWDETRQQMLDNFDHSDPTADRIANVVVLKITGSASIEDQLRLRFKVQTPTDRTTFLQERWHIDVQLVNHSNGMVNLVTTNDGGFVPLSVVTQLPTEPPPEPSHVAPLTRVEVVIELDPLDTGAEAFALTAPPGHSFVHPCRVPFEANKTNNPDAMRCFPLSPLNGRSRARVDCQADRSETNAKGLGTECFREAPAVVYVSTPETAIPPAENVWFVEAVDVIGRNYSSIGDRLGRGTKAGFDIENMDVQVVYGSLASVPVDIGIVFTSRVDVPPQGQVMIKGPPDLQQFGCENKRGTVKPGSLGTISSCQTAVNPPRVTLILNTTLKAGLHLVILPGETPRQNPQEALNTFDVFLRMPDQRNLDVSLKVPGEPVQQGLRASVLSFWWTQLLQFDPSFTVTVPIEILDDVDIAVYGILIDFPKDPDFRLDSADIQASRAFGEILYLLPFQARAGDNQLLLRLDKQRRLRTGLTLIRFPITRPESLPVFNFWRIAFCGDGMGGNGEGCTLGAPRTERGAAVISVFANGGFDPLEPSSAPEELRITTGGATRGLQVSLWLALGMGAALASM